MTTDSTDHEIARLEMLRQIPPLLPQFLSKRRVGLPAVEEVAQELGIDRPKLFALLHLNVLQGGCGGPVTLAQIRADDPYSVIDREGPLLQALVEQGLIEKDQDECYFMSTFAKQRVDSLHAAGREYVAHMHPLPDDELNELAAQLERAVEAIVADPVLLPRPGSHLAGRLSLAVFGEGAPAMVRIEQAVTSLWGARDDAHMRAWRDAGCEGPSMVALTQVWSGGTRTVEELQKALEYGQSAEDVESSLAFLAEKDYIVRDADGVLALTPEGVLVREDIERETDRVYFAPWPHTLDDARWVCEKLGNLVANLSLPPRLPTANRRERKR